MRRMEEERETTEPGNPCAPNSVNATLWKMPQQASTPTKRIARVNDIHQSGLRLSIIDKVVPRCGSRPAIHRPPTGKPRSSPRFPEAP